MHGRSTAKKYGSTVDWASTSATRSPQEGSSGVLAALRTIDGAIGYMDAGQGYNQAGMKEIHLLNKAGKYLKSSEAVLANAGIYAVENGIFPENYTDDWSDVNLLNLGDPSSNDLKQNTLWPITMVTYLYIEKDQSQMDPTSYGLLNYFAKFIATSPEGQKTAFLKDQFGFTPLPSEVLANNVQQLNTIVPPAKAVSFTSETDGGQPGESKASTQVKTGAGEYVISGKRKTYALTQREQTDSELKSLFSESDSPTGSALGKSLKDLIGSIESLKTSVENLEQKVTALENRDDTMNEVNVGSVHAPTADFQTAFTLICGLSTLWLALFRN